MQSKAAARIYLIEIRFPTRVSTSAEKLLLRPRILGIPVTMLYPFVVRAVPTPAKFEDADTY